MAIGTVRILCKLLGVAALSLPATAMAGFTVYDQGDRHLELGGRIQIQYKQQEIDAGEAYNDFFLRRLRFYFAGSLTENVLGKFEIDFGDTGEDPAIQSAYIAYTDLAIGTLYVGNQTVPFGREKLTSDQRQQLVERQFVGDHNYGVPDYQMGVSVADKTRTFKWQFGAYQAGIDPNDNRLDFTTRAREAAEYFGDMVAGRVEYNPFGHLAKAQGAFGSDFKVGLGVNAFGWRNDDDEVVNADADYDRVTGMGLDGALRAGYFSADVAVQHYASETRDPDYTGGLIADGEGDFDTYLVKGGYMLVPGEVEGVIGYSALSADAWKETDTRLSAGANFFINRHKSKIQMTYEHAENYNGEPGNHGNTLYIQFQQVL